MISFSSVTPSYLFLQLVRERLFNQFLGKLLMLEASKGSRVVSDHGLRDMQDDETISRCLNYHTSSSKYIIQKGFEAIDRISFMCVEFHVLQT